MAPKKTITPFQSTFRVQLMSRQDALRAAPKVFVPRKAHRKSRDGCDACKQKRVKCNGMYSQVENTWRYLTYLESKPSCARCAKLEIECRYSSSLATLSLHEPTDLALSTPSSGMYSMSVNQAGEELNNLLFGDASRPKAQDLDLSNLRMLQHFQNNVSLTLGCSRVQTVMHCFVANLAWSHPYLMHMCLAVACAHRKRYVMDDPSRKKCELAERTNWDQGLRLYRHHLADLEKGKIDGTWDADVTTTALQIMFTFALDDEIPLDSVNSTQDAFTHAMDPLGAIWGFGVLMQLYRGIDLESQWGQILLSSDTPQHTFTATDPGVKGMPRQLVGLCDLHETSTSENNPYHQIVRILTPLFYLERSEDNFPTLFASLGRTWSYFKPLLLAKDPRGLLLISYWLALLRQMDQWWLTTRAKTQCLSLVAYLSSLQDDKIHALLPFPAAFGIADPSIMWQLLEEIAQDVV